MEIWKSNFSIYTNLKTIGLTYKTRISLLLVIFISLVAIIPLLLVPKDGIIFVAPITAIVLVLLASIIRIKYVIDNDTLKIYKFFWMHDDIDIKCIKKMEPSRCILSSPAASLKRLAIHYNKYDVVYISPRNQEDFINEINDRLRNKVERVKYYEKFAYQRHDSGRA